jgi:hypothetical protein
MSLDLDIHHYSISDMEQLFKLKPTVKYTSSDIELREAEIRTQLLSSGHIDKQLKRDLIFFLTNVKQDLIRVKCPDKPPFTTLPPLGASVSPVITHVETPVYYPFVKSENTVPITIPNIRTNEIISNPQTPFTYTQNSDFLPGVMNPLTTRTLSRLVSVDTRFRESPYTTLSSDFTLHLPNRILKVVSLELSSFEISPFSIQNVSQSLGNNFLHVHFIDSSHTFVLPDGQYDSLKLMDQLNGLFQEYALSIYTDPVSGNTVIECEDPISIDFTTDMNGDKDKQDYFSKLGRLLGFTKRKYSGNILISETNINPYAALPYFFLSIDDFQNNSPPLFLPAFSHMTTPTSIIARISLLKNDHILQPVQIVSDPRRYFGPIDIQRLNIRLLDTYGRILDINADYSFCLLLHIVYDL